MNLKFLLKSTRPSLPLKKAPPLSPSPFLMEKVGCTRQYESELSLRSFAQPFPSGYRGCTNRPTRCSNRYAIRLADHQRFFRKPTRPSLPLKKAPPLFPSPFPLRGQGMYQPPYSVLKPLRYKVGGPSEVYASSRAAVFCAGMNPLSLKDLLKGCLLLWDSLDKVMIILFIRLWTE